MPRFLFFIMAMAILLLGCGRKHEKPPISNKAQQDTLLRQFINEEFKMFKPYTTRWFDILMEGQSDNKEIILYPGPIKLKAYFFPESFHYSPFAVKVSTVNDSLISFFTFTDEIFYLRNDIIADYSNDSITVRKHSERKGQPEVNCNLEDHLNTLIKKLGYEKNNYDIKKLLEALFINLLEMERINPYEISYVANRFRSIPYKDAEARILIEELTELAQLPPDEFEPRLKATTGTGGFWIFSIKKKNEDYHVKVKFIGDMIFRTIYL